MVEVGHEYTSVPIDALHGAEYNPRDIDAQQLHALKQSLQEFGFVQPVVVRREDNLIIGGHQRVAAMRQLIAEQGLEESSVTVPVVYLDGVDDKKAKMLNLALNKISGDWNYDKLSALLDGLVLTASASDLELSGFSEHELSSFATDPSDLLVEVDNSVDPDAVLASEARQFKFSITDPAAAKVIEEALEKFEQPEAFRTFMRICYEYLENQPEAEDE